VRGWNERHAGQGDPAGQPSPKPGSTSGQTVAPSGEAGQGGEAMSRSWLHRALSLALGCGSVSTGGSGQGRVAQSRGTLVLHVLVPGRSAPLFSVLRKPTTRLTLLKTWRSDQQSVVADLGLPPHTFGHLSAFGTQARPGTPGCRHLGFAGAEGRLPAEPRSPPGRRALSRVKESRTKCEFPYYRQAESPVRDMPTNESMCNLNLGSANTVQQLEKH
jgi:hypothetical protein